MAKIIIFGNGQLAEIAQFYIKHDTQHEIAAFTVDADFIENNILNGIPIVSFETIATQFPPHSYLMFMPISYRKVNFYREERYLQAKKMGYNFISYISPKATYYNTPIGENCFETSLSIPEAFVALVKSSHSFAISAATFSGAIGREEIGVLRKVCGSRVQVILKKNPFLLEPR